MKILILVAVLLNSYVPISHAIDIFNCEGKAIYSLKSGLLTLPLVNTGSGFVSAEFNLIPDSNPMQFVLNSHISVPQPEQPSSSQPCHSELFDSNNVFKIHTPIVSLQDGNGDYNVELTYQPASDNFYLSHAQPIQLARLEPLHGSYFGVNLDWEVDSVAGITENLGFSPNVFVKFAHFPLTEPEIGWLNQAVMAIESQNSGAMLVLTLEPHDGLEAITRDALEVLGQHLQSYNDLGVAVLVRFGHEMNGSWYAWGQQPQAYVEAFRNVAEVVHQTTWSAMLWAPNSREGYPFTGGAYMATPDAPDFSLLDTNNDGQLSSSDDPYAPYYPGDDVVDWVGLSLYHWGNMFPWGENEIPGQGKFIAQLTGDFFLAGDDEQSAPNFYHLYSELKNKPLSITETAALYVPDSSDSSPELERFIKQTWWRQIFSPETNRLFPNIKMINWFNWEKNESELGGKIVNWKISSDQELTNSFVEDLRFSNFGFY